MGGIFREASEQMSAKESSGHPDHMYICTVPMKKEIQKAIIQLKNGRAAGSDDIPAEVLKLDINTSVEMFYQLFVKICEKNEVL